MSPTQLNGDGELSWSKQPAWAHFFRRARAGGRRGAAGRWPPLVQQASGPQASGAGPPAASTPRGPSALWEIALWCYQTGCVQRGPSNAGAPVRQQGARRRHSSRDGSRAKRGNRRQRRSVVRIDVEGSPAPPFASSPHDRAPTIATTRQGRERHRRCSKGAGDVLEKLLLDKLPPRRTAARSAAAQNLRRDGSASSRIPLDGSARLCAPPSRPRGGRCAHSLVEVRSPCEDRPRKKLLRGKCPGDKLGYPR